MAEKTITLRVDTELHKKIKIRIAKKEITLKKYIEDLIKEDLEKNS